MRGPRAFFSEGVQLRLRWFFVGVLGDEWREGPNTAISVIN